MRIITSLQLASNKQEKFANQHKIKAPEFKVNDKVWVNSSLIIRNKNKKLKPRKLGPYKILEKVSPVTYKIDFPKKFIQLFTFLSLSHIMKTLLKEKRNLHLQS